MAGPAGIGFRPVSSPAGAFMRKLPQFIIVVTLVILAGAAVFLITFDIPPPSSQVEKVIPDDRFPR